MAKIVTVYRGAMEALKVGSGEGWGERERAHTDNVFAEEDASD